jgi:hypothetical protein
MDLLLFIALPGVVGGLVIALVLARLQGRRPSKAVDGFSDMPSTDVINAARIRVAGVGGLGLVAMALVVAWGIPRIGLILAVGLLLGGLFAGVLVWRRRQDGSMPSSGRRAGANTTLSIDSPFEAQDEPIDKSRKPRNEYVSVAPATSSRSA